MKKKLLALVLVMAMLLSCMLMLTSCPDDTPNVPAGDGELDLDEGLNDGKGSSDVTVVTDPNSDSAGAKDEDKYVHG